MASPFWLPDDLFTKSYTCRWRKLTWTSRVTFLTSFADQSSDITLSSSDCGERIMAFRMLFGTELTDWFTMGVMPWWKYRSLNLSIGRIFSVTSILCWSDRSIPLNVFDYLRSTKMNGMKLVRTPTKKSQEYQVNPIQEVKSLQMKESIYFVISGLRRPVKFSDKSGVLLDIFKVLVMSVRRFLKSLPEGIREEKKMTNRRRRKISAEEGFEARGRKRRRRELWRRENGNGGWEDSAEVPEGTQLVTIFLWTLILNISGHLQTLKFCYLLLMYTWNLN